VYGKKHGRNTETLRNPDLNHAFRGMWVAKKKLVGLRESLLETDSRNKGVSQKSMNKV